MTFFIPPVFLFGNNANRIPYDEEKKSEYKTAAETEIKVENWRAKRIAELEEENKNLKEKLSKREQGEYRYFGNDGEQDLYEITSIKDGPITYRKDSTGKWVADGEPPYVLC